MDTGGKIKINGVPSELPYFWFDPVNGNFAAESKVTTDGVFEAPDQKPWVLIVGERKVDGGNIK
jgi:hypothetical protein